MRAVHAFTLECIEERLHGRVIVAVGRATHTHLNALGSKQRLVAIAGVFAASIRMVKQTGWQVPTSQRHVQRECDQVLIVLWGHGPSHNHARKQIQDDGQVEPALCRWDGRDIAYPLGVGAGSAKVSVEDIRRAQSCRITLGGLGLGSAVRLGTQPQLLHQSHDAFASTMHTLCSQRSMNTWASIDPAMLHKNGLDLLGKPGIFSLALADRSMT